MRVAESKGFIPPEHFAKRGSHCNYAMMSKVFFVDTLRILHHPAAVGEEDFGDCYDHAAHPPTSIALQAWGVPRKACQLLFPALMLMRYFLRTGSGFISAIFSHYFGKWKGDTL